MNKSKFEWTDYTWSPVRGCLHACPYCYAARIDKRFGDGKFTPTFHPERLGEPLKVKKPSRIFVGSMADLFGDWDWKVEMGGSITRDYIIDCIFNIINQCLQHTFIFLTKNPVGMQGIEFPNNCWCGTSVENQDKAKERISELLKVNCKTLFVSYEPAIGPVDFNRIGSDQFGWGRLDALNGLWYMRANALEYGCDWETEKAKNKLKWLIIGAQTGPGAVKPNPVWTSKTIFQCREAGIPIFVKDNCKWPEVIREFPQ